MTIGINPQPSLLRALLTETATVQDGQPAIGGDKGFAGSLDRALGTDQPPPADQAQALAEALRLQMLQTTLSLAGDTPLEAPFASRPISGGTALLQELARAYGSKQEQPAPAPPAPARSARQELPEPDLIESVSAAHQNHLRPQTESWLDPLIGKASRRYGVDAGLIRAVIKAESDFNPTAVSHAGARGLMQLMPATARSLGVTDSFDPEQNVMAGTRFLKDLLDRYNGNLDSALAAYNWGPGNVDRRLDRMPRETRDYLAKVKQLYHSYSG